MSKGRAVGVAVGVGVAAGWLAYGITMLVVALVGGTDAIKPGQPGTNIAVLVLLIVGFGSGRDAYRRLRSRPA